MKRKRIYHFLGILLFLSLFTARSFSQETCATAIEIAPNGTYTAADLTGTGATQPLATAAAWYFVTITESGFLSVNSCSGGSDTRLWVYSGNCDALTPVADNDDACPHATDGTGDAYASRIDDISVSPGTYYFEWDDRWTTDGFVFNVTFVPLPTYDLALVKDNLPYRMLPFSQIPASGISLEGIVRNEGANELTGIVGTTKVYSHGSEVFSGTSDTLPSLSSSETDTILFFNGTPPDETSITVALSAKANETEEDTTNNTYSTNLIYRKTYALEDGQTNYFGYGTSPAILTQGQKFFFNNDDTLHSVSYFISGGQEADVVSVEIYAMDGDAIGTSLYSSGDVGGLFPTDGRWWNYEFPNGFPVTAGTAYFIALKTNQTGNTYLGLGTNGNFFYPGNAQVKLNDEDWSPIETYAQVSYLIRPNTGMPYRELSLTVDMSNENVVDTSGVFLVWSTSSDGEFNVSPMTNNGDNIWTYNSTFSVFDTLYYMFANGDETEPTSDLEVCGFSIGEGAYVRYLAPGYDDAIADTVCYGSCGNCGSHDVTLTVDMQFEDVNGGVLLFYTYDPEDDPDVVVMNDNGDDTWSYTLTVQDGYPLYYLYSNGIEDSTSVFETGITPACGFEIEDNLFVRYIPSVTENMADTSCFNTCGHCLMHDIALTVDMNHEETVADTVFAVTLSRLIFEEEDTDVVQFIPMNDNGDGTWSTTVSVLDGTNFYYLFANGNAEEEGEAEEVPDECSYDVTGIDLINIRYLPNVTDSDSIPTVCFSSCTPCPAANDDCPNAEDLTPYMGQPVDSVQVAGIFSNQYATINGDPADGYECFFLGDTIQNTVWFGFIGDGNEYHFETADCDGTEEYNNDTQMAIYSGDCDELVPEACNEDIDTGNSNFASALDFSTTAGTVYLMMIDGYYGQQGDFCIEVTRLAPPMVNVTFNVNMAHETVTDTVFIAGSFNGWSDEAMTDNGDQTYSFTTALAIGDTIEYKFKNGHDGWEDAIPADCSLGSFNNRYITVDEADMDIPMVCFNECADCTIGLNDPAFALGFNIYPNPTKGIANIDFSFDVAADLTLKLMNNLGQTVHVETLTNIKKGSHRLNLTDFAKGIYNLQIIRGDEILNKQLIVE